MSKQVKIKEVIETLCQLLHGHGFPKLPAEVLRQAKFNHKEAVLPLLELFSSVLVRDLKPDFKEWPHLLKFNLVLSILKRLDYPRWNNLYCPELHLLSSQELLLAFGFLMVELDIFGYLRYSAANLITGRIFQMCRDKSKRDTISPSQVSLERGVRLTKQIEFNRRDRDSSLGYLKKLLLKLNSIDKSDIWKAFIQQPTDADRSSGSKRPHKVSLMDVMLFENFRLQEDCISVLKKQNELLRLHVKWTQNEPMFWKWMATVQSKQASISRDYTVTSQQITERPRRDVFEKTAVRSSRNIEFILKEVLRKTDFKPDDVIGKSDSPEIHVDEHIHDFERELLDVEGRIRELREENKEWLTNFLYNNFPCVIQMPELKGNVK